MTRGRRPALLPALVPAALRGVLVLALLWAGALAPRVMPSRAADGGLVFEFCTGTGMVLMTLDAEGNPVPVEDPDAPAGHVAAPCAFAAAQLPATPLQPLLWALPDGALLGPVAPLVPASATPLRPVPSDHPPRGPPPAA